MQTKHKKLSNTPKQISIREAAKFLNVSIDTIRRWDAKGTLHSFRPNGKDRFFNTDELEKIKYSKPLSISDAAKFLGMSVSSLRRLELKEILVPTRNKSHKKLYTHEMLLSFKEKKGTVSLKPSLVTPALQSRPIEDEPIQKSFSSVRFALFGMAIGFIIVGVFAGYTSRVSAFHQKSAQTGATNLTKKTNSQITGAKSTSQTKDTAAKHFSSSLAINSGDTLDLFTLTIFNNSVVGSAESSEIQDINKDHGLAVSTAGLTLMQGCLDTGISSSTSEVLCAPEGKSQM